MLSSPNFLVVSRRVMSDPMDEIELYLNKEERMEEILRNLDWLSQIQFLLIGLQLLVTVLTVLGSIIYSHSW